MDLAFGIVGHRPDGRIKGGLLVWAADEIFRGVNPWRRCLGAAVLIYELATTLT